MVKAGKPVDDVIAELLPLFEPGDILIDGGNSLYTDTNRRFRDLSAKGLRFIGMGVSGGEEGALNGPSMMPGGEREAYQRIEPIVTRMAAEVDGTPCVTYIGPEGSGHYVKMVHNGIEYADMQLIAEAYDLLKSLYGLDASAIADIFEGWNKGDLDSYLIEITAAVLRKRDAATGGALVDSIVDEAEQKGTGRWAVQSALELGIPMTTITEAVFARALSARRAAAHRGGAAAAACRNSRPVSLHRRTSTRSVTASTRRRSSLMRKALRRWARPRQEFGWGLKLNELAMIWRGGCIIRARLLHRIREAYETSADAPNLVLQDFFRDGDHERRTELAEGRLAGGRRAAFPFPPSPPRSPISTGCAARAVRPICCRASATTSAPTPIAGSTSPEASTRAGDRMGMRLRWTNWSARSGRLPRVTEHQ